MNMRNKQEIINDFINFLPITVEEFLSITPDNWKKNSYKWKWKNNTVMVDKEYYRNSILNDRIKLKVFKLCGGTFEFKEDKKYKHVCDYCGKEFTLDSKHERNRQNTHKKNNISKWFCNNSCATLHQHHGKKQEQEQENDK